MPALALLAFQLWGLLWLAEMKRTVRNFPMAGSCQLRVRGKWMQKGSFTQGINSDYLISHLRQSLRLALSWETPVVLEERGVGMIDLWVEIEGGERKIERTRIPSSQLDSATC